MNTKEKLKEIIDLSLLKIDIEDVNYIIEVPNDKKNGDFSTNVAMELTRILRNTILRFTIKSQHLNILSLFSSLHFH